MRKSIILFFVILVITFVSSNLFDQKTSAQQSPQLTRDGKTNPTYIPDYVAYEFFFKSLINSPAEGIKGQKRVEAFALQTGLEAGEANLLLMSAQNIYRQITMFDQRIKQIKDQTWPNPPASVWNQLNDIEKQKESALVQTVESVFAGYPPKIANQLRSFINDHVKRHIKGYASKPNPGQNERPHHTTTGLVLGTFFSPLFSAAVQMQGNETVYIYSNATYTTGDSYVYGYGDVSATASSYGHEYSTRTEMYGPCNQFESGVGSNAMNIGLCDGWYSFYTIAVQSCPIANTLLDTGSNEDMVSVAPFVRLNALGNWSPDTISNTSQASASISISVNASSDFSGQVTLSFGVSVSNGTATFNITPAQGLAFSFSLGNNEGKTVTAVYNPASATGSPDVQAVCALGVPAGGPQALGSPQTSTSVLRIR